METENKDAQKNTSRDDASGASTPEKKAQEKNNYENTSNSTDRTPAV